MMSFSSASQGLFFHIMFWPGVFFQTLAPRISRVSDRPMINELLAQIQELHKRKVYGPKIALDDELLDKINVTRAKEKREHIGMVKHGTRLTWPKTLMGDRYRLERERVGPLLSEAVKQAKKGEASPKSVEEMEGLVQKIKACLGEQVEDLTPEQYIESVRFIRQLNFTMKALQRKDVSDYFKAAKELPAQCRTVADLVKYMTERQLQFAIPPQFDAAAPPKLRKALRSYIDKAQAPRDERKKSKDVPSRKSWQLFER